MRIVQVTEDDITGEVTTDDLTDVVYHSDKLTDVAPHTETLEAIKQHIEPLPHLWRDQRDMLNERRRALSQQLELPGHRGSARRGISHLREENRWLRFELQKHRDAVQQLLQEYSHFQVEVEKEIAVIHNGYKQEIEQHQSHFRVLMEERNRIQESYIQAEERLQDLYQVFEEAAAQEARKQLNEALQALEASPDKVPPLLQEIVSVLDARARQVEDKHLVEALFLKHEVQALAEQARISRQELEAERRQLAAIQLSARQQAELRQKTLYSRIRARWRVASVSMSVGLLALLVVLQYAFLALFHVAIPAPVSLSILAPIMLCILLAVVFSQPLTMVKQLYAGAPHKKKMRKEH